MFCELLLWMAIRYLVGGWIIRQIIHVWKGTRHSDAELGGESTLCLLR
jgi:hypothetical protein